MIKRAGLNFKSILFALAIVFGFHLAHPQPAKGSVALALEYAYKVFPNGPCERSAVVQPVDNIDQKYRDTYGVQAAPGRMWVGYWSPHTPCVLYVDAQETRWIDLCNIIIHEYGHSFLRGFNADHSYKGAEGIMDYDDLEHSICENMPSSVSNAVDFKAVLKPVSKKQAVDAVMQKYAKHIRKWVKKRVRCVTAGPLKVGSPWKCSVPAYFSVALDTYVYQDEVYQVYWNQKRKKPAVTDWYYE